MASGDGSEDGYVITAELAAVTKEKFGVFREDYSLISSRFENMLTGLQHMRGGWPQSGWPTARITPQ